MEQYPEDAAVWFAPGEKHWHDEAPTTAVTHLALQEHLKGQPTARIEKVRDKQY